MTQGLQIGTTGHPPEWHVLLRTERWDDGILSEILFKMFEYLTVVSQKIVFDKAQVGKKVSQNFFFTQLFPQKTLKCVNIKCFLTLTPSLTHRARQRSCRSVELREVNWLVGEHFSAVMKKRTDWAVPSWQRPLPRRRLRSPRTPLSDRTAARCARSSSLCLRRAVGH